MFVDEALVDLLVLALAFTVVPVRRQFQLAVQHDKHASLGEGQSHAIFQIDYLESGHKVSQLLDLVDLQNVKHLDQ